MNETRIEDTSADTPEAPARDAPGASTLASALQASAAIAGETAALAGALAQLARTEALLSARSLGAALGWRAVAVLALIPAWILLLVAAVSALATLTGSLAWACTLVALAHGLAAALAFLRARALAARAGFTRTRAALAELAAAEPPQ